MLQVVLYYTCEAKVKNTNVFLGGVDILNAERTPPVCSLYVQEMVTIESYSVIPDRFRVLSNSTLKVIAVVTMLIDHYASVFLKDSTIVVASVLGRKLTLYLLLRYIGRLAFPIFAFLLVEGYMHTHDRRRYGVRLFAFALISEIPWNLEHSGTLFHPSGQNVFFTLLLGYLGICAADRLQKEENKKKYAFFADRLVGAEHDRPCGFSGGGLCLYPGDVALSLSSGVQGCGRSVYASESVGIGVCVFAHRYV